MKALGLLEADPNTTLVVTTVVAVFTHPELLLVPLPLVILDRDLELWTVFVDLLRPPAVTFFVAYGGCLRGHG